MKSKLLLTMKIWREGKYFVAYNPELDVASQGKTEAQAQDNLKEALELFLETTKKMGTTRQVLQDAGFQLKSGKKEYQPPHLSFAALDVVL